VTEKRQKIGRDAFLGSGDNADSVLVAVGIGEGLKQRAGAVTGAVIADPEIPCRIGLRQIGGKLSFKMLRAIVGAQGNRNAGLRNF